jgi:hypothetical protein
MVPDTTSQPAKPSEASGPHVKLPKAKRGPATKKQPKSQTNQNSAGLDAATGMAQGTTLIVSGRKPVTSKKSASRLATEVTSGGNDELEVSDASVDEENDYGGENDEHEDMDDADGIDGMVFSVRPFWFWF